MIFSDIGKEYKKIFVFLVATNCFTATTTTSKRVVEFLRTPFTNRENISYMKEDIKELSAKVDTLIVSSAAISRSLNDYVLKDSIHKSGVSLHENLAGIEEMKLNIANR